MLFQPYRRALPLSSGHCAVPRARLTLALALALARALALTLTLALTLRRYFELELAPRPGRRGGNTADCPREGRTEDLEQETAPANPYVGACPS